MRGMRDYIGRRTSETEVRTILVEALRSPQFDSDLAIDLRNTNAMRRARALQPFAGIHELLATFYKPKQFIPPMLCARAYNWLTGESIRLLSYDTHEILTLYDSTDNGAESVDVTLFYDDSAEHVIPVVARLQQARTEPKLMDFFEYMERMSSRTIAQAVST
jgi:hypothetical protein